MLKFKHVSRNALASVFLISGLAIPRPAISQNSDDQAALFCGYKSDEHKKIVFSDIILVTRSFHDAWQASGDYRGWPQVSEFGAYMATKSGIAGNASCETFDSAVTAKRRRDRRMVDWSLPGNGFTTSIAPGWRPASLEARAPARQKPAPAETGPSNYTLKVRSPDTPVVVKPAAKPAPKPAVKPKPVAKPAPVPRKPSTPCGRKGQPTCSAFER